MPRVSIIIMSGDAVSGSFTDTAFGGSAGISFASGVGVGFSLAYDYLDTVDGPRNQLGVAVSYIIGG